MLCAGWCVAADSGGTKFRLNIGAGGAYVSSLEYLNQFDSSYTKGPFSKGSIIPTANIGLAINHRFSIFLRYSNFLVFSDRSYEKFQQLGYLGVASSVIPSEKFSNLYLDYSLGAVLSWPSTMLGTFGFWYHGAGTTVACGYRVNKHLRVQADMDYLCYTFGLSINRVTINPGDLTNTIDNSGGPAFGTSWFNIVVGLSTFWDIF